MPDGLPATGGSGPLLALLGLLAMSGALVMRIARMGADRMAPAKLPLER